MDRNVQVISAAFRLPRTLSVLLNGGGAVFLIFACICGLLACGDATIEISGGDFGPGCVPGTCESLGARCGEVEDGCGGMLDCGSCGEIPPGECEPMTCAGRGFNCGKYADGCGGTMYCGT